MAYVASFKIGGINYNPFMDWRDAELVASGDDSATELNITINSVIFTNAAAKFIRDYIAQGVTGQTNGYYEGPEFEMIVADDADTLTAFKGCLDFAEDYKEISPVKVRCALRRLQDKKTVSERAKVTTMLLLQEEGIITPADIVTIPYIVQKRFDALEFLMLSITTFLMLRELADTIRRLSKDNVDAAAHAAGGISGPVAAAVYTVLIVIINLAYAILIIIYIIELINELIELLISPVRDWKGMKFKTMLERGSEYLGYDYSTTPTLFNDLYYMPSKTEPAPLSQQIVNIVQGSSVVGVPDDGIPNSGDVGHTLEECYQLHADLVRSKMNIDEDADIIHQEPLINDTFWDQDATFTLPNTLNESKVYNGSDLISRILLRFESDDRDDWTIADQLGRIYEIVTHPITIGNDKCVNMKGLSEVRFGVALGSRKDGLTGVEQAVKALASIADGIVNFFGGNSNLAGNITNRVGMLRVSENSTNVPKMLYLKPENGVLKLPANHKSVFSAKALWEFHKEDSWVETVNGVPNRGQKQFFNDEPLKIPLGFQETLSIVDKTRINDLTGAKANVTHLRWKFSRNMGLINGWRRQVYTKNLQHTFYDSDDPTL